VRGWCPSLRQGRPSDSKSTYKGNLHLPPFKGTNEAQTRVLSDSRPVFLPIDQVFGVK